MSGMTMGGAGSVFAWTLIHSIWQASLIAGGLWLALRLIPGSMTRVRTAAASTALALVLGLGLATWIAIDVDWRNHDTCWSSESYALSHPARCASHGVPLPSEALGVDGTGPGTRVVLPSAWITLSGIPGARTIGPMALATTSWLAAAVVAWLVLALSGSDGSRWGSASCGASCGVRGRSRRRVPPYSCATWHDGGDWHGPWRSREALCDRAAAGVPAADRRDYVETLLRLEALRTPAGPALIGLLGEGPLLRRVRRLIESGAPRRRERLGRGLAAGLVAVVVLAATIRVGVSVAAVTSWAVMEHDIHGRDVPEFEVVTPARR